MQEFAHCAILNSTIIVLQREANMFGELLKNSETLDHEKEWLNKKYADLTCKQIDGYILQLDQKQKFECKLTYWRKLRLARDIYTARNRHDNRWRPY